MSLRKLKYNLFNLHHTSRYILTKRSMAVDVDNIKSINFVCHGNICRSAFSEYYTRNALKEMGLPIETISCGISADQSSRPPDNAIIASRQFGIDLRNHVPSPMTKEHIDKSSIIFCMHYCHYMTLKYRYPQYEERTYLLKHIMWPRQWMLSIDDPYDKPLEVFITCFSEIKSCIDMLVHRIHRNYACIEDRTSKQP